MSCVRFEKRKREAERQARANFVHRMSVRQRVTYADIETQIVANPPDQADQTGYRFRLAKFVLVENFRDRPNGPCRWSLENGVKENIAVMIAGEGGLRIEMDCSQIGRASCRERV